MNDWFDAPIEVKEEEEIKKESFFFRFLTDISYDKEFLLSEENEKEYSPYMVNRFLSMDVSTIMYAQDMNVRPSLEKDMHYLYLINAVRKKKRFFRYVKDKKDEAIQLLSDYYNCSLNKAKEIFTLHTKQDLENIALKMNVGGSNAKKKRRAKSK